MVKLSLIAFFSRFLPAKKWRRAARRYVQNYSPVLAYSQEGEDLILQRFFAKEKPAFYVDVGAHHPFRYSNTTLLNQKGWRGINVDPLPGTKKLFDRIRPKDINLEVGISKEEGVLTYFRYDDPALNTFVPGLVEDRKTKGIRPLSEQKIPVRPLAKVLEEHLPSDADFRLLSVDAEGLDFDVLNSNDWSRFRPEVIIVEALSFGFDRQIVACPTTKLLADLGYQMIAKTFNSVFFRRIEESDAQNQ